ncbi:MAG: leucine-rich repeat protein [Prevotella sp.]|nr:leucine-rich repeat protein [Prevotella sp.]
MKHLKFLFALAALWMAGSIGLWAAVGDTFTAANMNGVDITYLVLTEDGTTGTVQVGDGSNQAVPTTTVDGETVFDIPEGTFVIPSTVDNEENPGITYTVTAIGGYAFYEYGMTLTAIDIPSTVTEIGSCAFLLSKLKSVTLPNGLTSIGDDAFRECTDLEAIEIPQSVNTIGYGCFSVCSQLQTVTLHAGNLTKIDDDVFSNCSITSIDIPSGVTSIGYGAFSYCSSLQSVVLPDGLTSIGSYAFSNCVKLQALDIPSSVSYLGSNFAEYCTELATVTLNEGNLKEISEYAFYYSGITDITIPEGVTDIDDCAFHCCTSLKTVFIPSTVSKLGEQAFDQCNALEEVTFLSEKELTLPSYRVWLVFHKASGKIGVLKLPLGSQFTKNYPSIAAQFDSVVEMLMVGSKITVDNHNYRVLTLPDGDTNGTVQLGAGFSYPGYSYGVYGEVTITDKITLTHDNTSYTFNVTTLGEAAFANTYYLGGITIPAAITLIKKDAIYNCENLERVYVKSETPCTLEEDAFYGTETDNCMLVVPAGCMQAYEGSNWNVFTKIRELGNEIDWPQLAENQNDENEYNDCEALTELTRWFPNSTLYEENNMWNMPHMMDGKFYVSAFWQSNNSSTMTESISQNIYIGNDDYLQLCYNPAFLSPNYGSGYIDDGAGSGTTNHDDQAGATVGGFICFKVKGSGTIIVRGFTETNNAYMGICVQGKQPSYFSGTDDREYSYSYSLDSEDDEAYAYVYGANLSINGRHAFIKYIKFGSSQE